MNDIQYRILELLALSRTHGMFQTDLAAKLNVDAKTVFFHLKKLDVHGLLYVQKIVINNIITYYYYYIEFVRAC
jgi:predicted transcriptional regulator